MAARPRLYVSELAFHVHLLRAGFRANRMAAARARAGGARDFAVALRTTDEHDAFLVVWLSTCSNVTVAEPSSALPAWPRWRGDEAPAATTPARRAHKPGQRHYARPFAATLAIRSGPYAVADKITR